MFAYSLITALVVVALRSVGTSVQTRGVPCTSVYDLGTPTPEYVRVPQSTTSVHPGTVPCTSVYDLGTPTAVQPSVHRLVHRRPYNPPYTVGQPERAPTVHLLYTGRTLCGSGPSYTVWYSWTTYTFDVRRQRSGWPASARHGSPKGITVSDA